MEKIRFDQTSNSFNFLNTIRASESKLVKQEVNHAMILALPMSEYSLLHLMKYAEVSLSFYLKVAFDPFLESFPSLSLLFIEITQ